VDPGPFFYIVITVYHLLALFTFSQTTIFYHSIRLILCLWQTGEIENLTVSWGKVLGCVVCRFHVAVVIIIPSSWGSQLGGHLHAIMVLFQYLDFLCIEDLDLHNLAVKKASSLLLMPLDYFYQITFKYIPVVLLLHLKAKGSLL
jgi:hypothetical protein